MKAISIKQPWAGLIMSGLKTLEVRTWRTKYRGPLLIHSTLSPDLGAFDKLKNLEMPLVASDEKLLLTAEFLDKWKIGITGAVIGVVDLLDCREMTLEDEENALYPFSFKKKQYVFVLGNPRNVSVIRISGHQRIFESKIRMEDLEIIKGK